MIHKLKMIWRIIRDKQVVVITEDHGKMYYNWDARSIEDACAMCRITLIKVGVTLNQKSNKQ